MIKYRVFLDANILFSAAYKPGSTINELLNRPELDLATSGYALEEARRNLIKIRPAQLECLEALLDQVQIVSENNKVDFLPDVQLPEKDLPILYAAINSEIDILLTGDFRHFGALLDKDIQGCKILSPALLWRLLNS